MKIDEFVGKTMQHETLGRVKVLARVPKSRTLVEIEVRDKGQGYDPDRKKYTGVRKPGGWMRGQNYQHGHRDRVHINALK